jgi:hypothetical protein
MCNRTNLLADFWCIFCDTILIYLPDCEISPPPGNKFEGRVVLVPHCCTLGWEVLRFLIDNHLLVPSVYLIFTNLNFKWFSVCKNIRICITQVYLALVSHDRLLWFVTDRHTCLMHFEKGKFSKYVTLITYKESLLALVLCDINQFYAVTSENYYVWEVAAACVMTLETCISRTLSVWKYYIESWYLSSSTVLFSRMKAKTNMTSCLKDATLLWNVSQKHSHEL